MRTTAAIIAGASLVAGCSLLVSTSGLDTEAAAPLLDAATESAVATDAPVAMDAPTDAGSDAPSDPSLVGAWSFDEPSGPVSLDTSGHGHDALIVGAAHSPDGVRGGTVVFDGGSGHVDVQAFAGSAFPPSGTLSIWFKASAAPVDGVERAVFDGWDFQRRHLFLRFTNQDGGPNAFQTVLQEKGANVPYPWANVTMVARDAWTHVVVTWSAADKSASLYVGGNLMEAKAYGAQAQDFVMSEQVFTLGNRFVGAIDEVRLYDRTLPPAEAASLP